MGSQLLKNYNMEKESFLSGGFNNYWKIYKGVHKERKLDVCAFVFEKSRIDKYSKDQKEEIMNILRKEAKQLVKYKHPNILSVVEPLLEDKESIIFVTEPISYSLNSWIDTTSPSKLEIKLLMTELCSSLMFLHEDAKVIHLSLNPDSVFISANSKIKISGFNFSISDPPGSTAEFKISGMNSNVIPVLKNSAPELILQNIASYSSDIFSIGTIIYYMLKIYKGENDRELINVSGNEVSSYKTNYELISNKLSKMSFEIEDVNLINKLCERNHDMRVTVREILNDKWFNDPKIKALRFVENLEANEAGKITEFLNSFPHIISHFENKIIEKKFLPSLLNAMKSDQLIISLLPAIFVIVEGKYKIDFEQQVWPSLKTLFQMKQIPAQALYFILSKICVISEKISNTEFCSNLLNIICKALDCNVTKIQAVVLDNITFIIKKIDSLAFKNQIFPRLVNIVLNTSSGKIKVEILKVFHSVYNLLDQNIINESLLNTLEKVRKQDNTSDVCIAIVGVYEEIAKVVSVESIANKILPNLISILVSGNISKSNFETIMNLVQKYLSRIKESREKDLTDDVQTKSETFMESTQTKPKPAPGSLNDDFLSAFFGTEKSETTNQTISKPETKQDIDLDFISKGMEETKKKSEKSKSIFDGIEKKSDLNPEKPKILSTNNGSFPKFETTKTQQQPDFSNFDFPTIKDTKPTQNNSFKPSTTLNIGKPKSNKTDDIIMNSLLNDLNTQDLGYVNQPPFTSTNNFNLPQSNPIFPNNNINSYNNMNPAMNNNIFNNNIAFPTQPQFNNNYGNQFGNMGNNQINQDFNMDFLKQDNNSGFKFPPQKSNNFNQPQNNVTNNNNDLFNSLYNNQQTNKNKNIGKTNLDELLKF